MKTALTTSLEERALALLASGIPAVQVADILGVDASRISQLCSQDEFAVLLAEKKFEVQQKHNLMDAKLDDLENLVLDRLGDTLNTVYKPLELVRVLQVLNAAKRRGSVAATNIDNERREVINLTMPVQVIARFEVNAQNQVVRTENRDLITIQSNALEGMAAADNKRLQQQITVNNSQNKNDNTVGESNATT